MHRACKVLLNFPGEGTTLAHIEGPAMKMRETVSQPPSLSVQTSRRQRMLFYDISTDIFHGRQRIMGLGTCGEGSRCCHCCRCTRVSSNSFPCTTLVIPELILAYLHNSSYALLWSSPYGCGMGDASFYRPSACDLSHTFPTKSKLSRGGKINRHSR